MLHCLARGECSVRSEAWPGGAATHPIRKGAALKGTEGRELTAWRRAAGPEGCSVR
eukprot:COSAG06_NODE_1835_length_8257_cov_14.244300_5_plen_56_part_00